MKYAPLCAICASVWILSIVSVVMILILTVIEGKHNPDIRLYNVCLLFLLTFLVNFRHNSHLTVDTSVTSGESAQRAPKLEDVATVPQNL